MPNILDLIEQGCRRTATVRFLPREPDALTLGEVWRRSQLAGRWMATNVGSEGVVAAVLDSSSSCLAGLLGAWIAGVTVASLPYPARGMSVEAYADQIVRMCSLVSAERLLIDGRYGEMASALPLRVTTFHEVMSGGASRPNGRRGSFIQFTSGSTAEPKGVELSLEAIGANASAIVQSLELQDAEVVCSWLPLSHDMGLVGMCLSSLVGAAAVREGQLVLIAPELFVRNPEIWLSSCSEVGATITAAPNFGLELAVRSLHRSGPLDLSRLRVCISGAERVRAETLRSFESALAGAGLRSSILSPAYGLAEATLAVSMVRPPVRWRGLAVDREALWSGRWIEAEPGHGLELVSNGPPIPGMSCRIRDPSPSTIGEIEVNGPSLLGGYVGSELRLTEDRWFPTRDLGFVADGELFVVARTDELLVVGGRNFTASDLEGAVHHPAVRPGNVAAVPADDGRYVIVAEARADVRDPQTLADACRQIRSDLLRTWGVSPSAVVFVAARSLVKTPTGKLQRFQIQQSFEAGQLSTVAEVRFRRRTE